MKSVIGLIAISILLLFSSCKPGPTTIVGSVSFLNSPANPRTFPPSSHPGTVDGDVCYVRLVENDGAGPGVLWLSPAYPVTFLGNYTYDPADTANQNPTAAEGVLIKSFFITLTETQLSAAVMPLRLEAYMYDTAVAVPDPATDPERYSYYDPSGEGDPGWFYSFNIQNNEVKTSRLSVTVPFP